MPHSINRLTFCLVLCCLFVQVTTAQDLPATDTLKLKTKLVLLDAQVTDKKTREIVRGLKQGEFELFEDGVKQEIEHFSQDKLPLSLVLLLDVSPSVTPVLEEIRQGALQALQRLKPEDEVALMIFSGWTELIQDFTKDRALILAKLGEALQKKGSGTRIHEAVAKAARQFKHSTLTASRRVVIVITDNQGSMSRQYDDLSEAAVRDAVIEANATYCGVIARSLINILDGILFQHPALQETIKRTSVNPYVELTGGEMTAASKETINTRLGEMIERLRSGYSLGYMPINQDFNGKFRRIKLTLTSETQKRLGGECVINAKQGYYALERDDDAWLADVVAWHNGTKTDPKPASVLSAPTPNSAAAATPATNTENVPAAVPAETASVARAPATTVNVRPRRIRPKETVNPFAQLVLFDVLALNKKTGAAITNLSADDFELEDNGAKRPLAYFRQGETPLSVVLMVDVAGNTGYTQSALRRTAKLWLNKLAPEDEVALMAFRSKTALMQDFTTDRKLLTARLRNFGEEAGKLELGYGQDRTLAVFQAADQFDKSGAPLYRRVIIVVTDDAKSYAASPMEQAARLASDMGCTVYALVAASSKPSGKSKLKRAVIESAIFSFGNPVSFAIGLGTRLGTEAALDALLKDRSFTRLVTHSGGVLSRADGDEASEQLAQLLSRLHDRYVLGFTPAPHTTGEQLHKLNLKLKGPANKRAGEVTFITRQSYFARGQDTTTAQNATAQPKH